MRLQILDKCTKDLITITLKELVDNCGPDYSEFDVLQALNEMRQRNEIEYINISKKIAV